MPWSAAVEGSVMVARSVGRTEGHMHGVKMHVDGASWSARSIGKGSCGSVEQE